ncbi:MAG: hypothetical protein JAY85_06685 [Candidatus Thiodiazotropha weberae]|uniref:hypothetical protein n=1 Tax=Candidatus Thiodiazotropha endoloripes TaxID=1818881 RepID=UPI00114CDE57|nr:hypothetical protein [Candidatus Thiodiazotropha endoloripes]MCG7898128.1 hypothetical protein [Candidatus Thiodiazotropha weberae]
MSFASTLISPLALAGTVEFYSPSAQFCPSRLTPAVDPLGWVESVSVMPVAHERVEWSMSAVKTTPSDLRVIITNPQLNIADP